MQSQTQVAFEVTIPCRYPNTVKHFMGERGRGREREQLLLKGDRNLCKERKEARESHEFVIVVKR